LTRHGVLVRDFGWLYQLRHRRAERRCEAQDRAERRVALGTLEVSDLVAVESGSLSQVLL
jgi:hypothetical protein